MRLQQRQGLLGPVGPGLVAELGVGDEEALVDLGIERVDVEGVLQPGARLAGLLERQLHRAQVVRADDIRGVALEALLEDALGLGGPLGAQQGLGEAVGELRSEERRVGK